MQVRCDREVFEKFPDASIHGIVFERVDRFGKQDSVAWKLRALESVRAGCLNLSSFTLDQQKSEASFR